MMAGSRTRIQLQDRNMYQGDVLEKAWLNIRRSKLRQDLYRIVVGRAVSIRKIVTRLARLSSSVLFMEARRVLFGKLRLSRIVVTTNSGALKSLQDAFEFYMKLNANMLAVRGKCMVSKVSRHLIMTPVC